MTVRYSERRPDGASACITAFGRRATSTVTHPAFSELRARFYTGSIKVVPIEYVAELLSPLALAVWIMDDGSADGNALRINTQSFTPEENQGLTAILRDRYGLRATLNRDKDAFRLRIASSDRDNLTQLLEPYILPDLRYKLKGLKSA